MEPMVFSTLLLVANLGYLAQGQQCSRLEGKDIHSGRQTLKSGFRSDQCCSLCRQEANCKGFAWNSWNGGTCYLKSDASLIVNAPGVISGVLQEGGGGGGDGKHRIEMINRCQQKIWVGILGNPGKGQPLNGGFELGAGARRNVYFDSDWVGRMWGRTGCRRSGGRLWCETGDCGGAAECNGRGGQPPATLAEINFRAHAGLDFYDVSLVDGYNLPIKFSPIKRYSGGRCLPGGCRSDLLASCPNELKKWKDGRVVGCLSSCSKYNTDEYCCRGSFGTPDRCMAPRRLCSAAWTACPDAYCYAYDDKRGTFTCKAEGEITHYTVTFC